MFEACDTRLARLKFYNPDEKKKAKDLRNQSGEKITAATTKADEYKFLEDSDLETYKYDEIKTNIDAAMALFKEGIALELEAWKMQLNQLPPPAEPVAATPAEQPVASAPAEQPAAETTTTQAVSEPEKPKQEILVEKPLPPEEKPVASQQESAPVASEPVETVPSVAPEPAPAPPVAAPAPVQTAKATPSVEPAKPAKPAKSQSPVVQGVVYKVQIAAIQRGQLPDYVKQELYSGNRTLTEDFEDGFYKYRVGDFNSFSDARAFIEEYGKEAFVVKFVNGVKQ
jgi:hypothetical protein